ncbi:MAG: transporter substrate-binding domain-containing protein, partial [Bermanella sp.]
MAKEKVINLAASEYPPYFSESMKNYGFITEITVEAFKKAGYTVKVEFLPFKRAYLQTREGQYDAIIDLWYTKEREEYFEFSHPLPSNILGFYKHKKNDIKFKIYSDLKPYKIGIVRISSNNP